MASGCSIPGLIPTLNLLPQGRQGHISPASAEVEAVPQRSLVNIEVEASYSGQPMMALESPFMSSDKRVIHDEEWLERKRKVSADIYSSSSSSSFGYSANILLQFVQPPSVLRSVYTRVVTC